MNQQIFDSIYVWQLENFSEIEGEEASLIEIQVNGVELIRWTSGVLHTGAGMIDGE